MLLRRSTRVSSSPAATTAAAITPPSVTATRVMYAALFTGTLAVSLAAASVAHAAPVDRQLFTWTGRVDREVYITMRGRDVRTSGADAGLPNRARVNEALPRGQGDVMVRLLDGRGDVRVVEQPSARNGYTTTIRITDQAGGADNYRVAAVWQGDDRYDRNDDRYDRNDDRYGRNDDRYDRRNDRNDRDECGPNNNGRGGGWGRGGRKENCDYRPGRGNGNGNRDRDDRGGYDRGGYDDRNGGSGSLRWSGQVDDVVEIRINGRRVETITRSGRRVESVNSNIRGGGLPSRDATVTVDRNSGRGSVQVTQQPAAWNNYTAVIRIYDSQGGASYYDVNAYWN